MKKMIQEKEYQLETLEAEIRTSEGKRGESSAKEVMLEVKFCITEGQMTISEAMDNCIAREILTSTEKGSRYEIIKSNLPKLLEGYNREIKILLLDQLIVDFG